MINRNTNLRTFQNKDCSFATIDQQHLSNIYYYWKYAAKAILNPNSAAEAFLEFKDLVKFELNERFNGQLLAYRPHAQFKQEIEALRKLGMLQGNMIKAEGVIIGYIVTMD